jgi:BioD-like phosphotransacetylase family protein
LPLFAAGMIEINHRLAAFCEGNTCCYFHLGLPVFSHDIDDINSFRQITSQLINSGACRNHEIVDAFGVSKSSVVRALRKLRKEGSSAFFSKKKENEQGQS